MLRSFAFAHCSLQSSCASLLRRVKQKAERTSGTESSLQELRSASAPVDGRHECNCDQCVRLATRSFGVSVDVSVATLSHLPANASSSSSSLE